MVNKYFQNLIKYLTVILPIYFFSINFVSAQATPTVKQMSLPDFKDIGGLIVNFNDNILQNLVVLLSGIAVVLFLYGLVRFIFHRSQGTEASKLKDDKKNMLWGLGALFVLVTLWGIINLFQGILDLDKSDNNIHIPKICVNDNCDTTSSLPGAGGGIIQGSTGCGDGFKQDPTTGKCIPVPVISGSTNNGGQSYTGDYTANSILGWSLIMKEGNTGENVAQLQKFLKDYNFGSTLTIDGKYGPATTAAVKAFQSASKLVPDGMIGPATRAVIVYRYLQANPRNEVSFIANWPDLSYGNQGEPVRELQALLKQKGCFLSGSNDNSDSTWGDSTDKAVANYQSKNSLKEDHIVGPSTRAVMMASDTNNC